MVEKHYKKALLFFFFLWNTLVFAQGIPGQNVSTDLQEEAAKYEQYYEIILNNSLTDYYKRGTFIVDAKATLERILVPTGYEKVEGEEAVKLENLPGLPFVPPNLRKNTEGTADSIKASGFDARFRLTRLSVKVLVDTSYSNEDVEFVEEAVSLIANADPYRGDIVSVEKKVFPRSARAIEQDVVAALEEPEMNQKEDLGAIPISTERVKNEFLGIDWNDPKQLLYVIAALGALLLIVLIYALLKKPSTKNDEKISVQPYPLSDVVNTSAMQVSEKKAPDAKVLAQFEADKTFITNNCISHPGVIANMLGQWVATDDEQGVIRAAKGLASVDDKLINVLEPHMKVENYEVIKHTLGSTETLSLDEKIEFVQAFKRSIQQLNSINGAVESGSNLFDFMSQLTDIQVLHLMKEESDELVAILLAQIAGERAGTILQKLSDEKRISILLKMGKINNIPISVYKKVAAHFSNKALAVSDMKYVAADGVDSILTTIETLPLSEQDEYVRSIAEQDLNLAKRIRKYFIGFDDLPKVRDEVLQSALESIQTDVIILALKTAPAAVREKVLKVRPKREQQLILSEIDSPSQVPKATIEEAQKNLLYAVRRKMRAEG